MITVIGMGFVGLTTALGFSEHGFTVYGYDTNRGKAERLREGIVPFYEPNLDNKLKQYVNNRFHIVDDLKGAVDQSELVFICVGTPSLDNGEADLSYIFQAIKSVAECIEKPKFKVLVIKSTVPPSTTSECIKPYIESLGFQVDDNIGLANNPEFLREGYAWNDFMNPDRIVIGQLSEKSGQLVEQFYAPFHAPVYRVSLTTAEFIKYLSNTLLATLISFANEQSLIARAVGDIDIRTSFRILHQDRRWFGAPAAMTSYVYPGCGFGGYCLPKDTLALISQSIKKGYSPELLKNTIQVNQAVQQFVVRDIAEKASPEETIGILGLAFKPNSSDIRDTPAKRIIEQLIENGFSNIVVYDPMAMEEFKEVFSLPVEYAVSLSVLLEKTQHVVLLTAWDEFVSNADSIRKKHLFDYRYVFG